MLDFDGFGHMFGDGSEDWVRERAWEMSIKHVFYYFPSQNVEIHRRQQKK